MKELYIGLISGTSADGIDAALVDAAHHKMVMLDHLFMPYPNDIRNRIFALYSKQENEIAHLGELDIQLGQLFAEAATQLIRKCSLPPSAICAIGSHGQTVRHHPHPPHPFTLQIADPNTIAALTGITTVADFRRKDMALGGQGAPLVPAFHRALFGSAHINRVVLNIGGIANITLLPNPPQKKILGFDTGPGNALMDAWINKHVHLPHDERGQWAKSGKVETRLLNRMLDDPYFKMSPPKSTGREYFHLDWILKHLSNNEHALAPVDVQTTLAELTALSILKAIKNHIPTGEILVCGGGVHNEYLMNRLVSLAGNHFEVRSMKALGIDPDLLEAMAFAWLAYRTLSRQSGNLPSVTGASREAMLGGIYYP